MNKHSAMNKKEC